MKKVKNNSNVVLITTYESLKNNNRLLKFCQWEYMVLDEGHKLSIFQLRVIIRKKRIIILKEIIILIFKGIQMLISQLHVNNFLHLIG
jgi:SNF2 family DNA or RNA helicase